MRKSKLIAKLSSIKGDPEINIIDLTKNFGCFNNEDGFEKGIYKNFDVEHMNGFKITSGVPEFIALTFKPLESNDAGFINKTHKEQGSDACYKTGLKCTYACVGQCKESC